MGGDRAHQAPDRVVVAEHRGGEAADARGPRGCGQLAGEQGAEAAALERVADDDRELRRLGPVGQADAARDADDRLRIVGEEGGEREVVAAVDLGEVAQLARR